MRIAMASDHAAVGLKAALADWLRAEGHEVEDLGTDGEASVDYPDFGYRLAGHVAAGKAERGVALCGTGIGISIAVNRHPGVRCALVSEPLSATLSREHNDANVIAMGARIIGIEMAKACLTAFLTTPFGGDRHARRVGKLGQPLI
ncbi:MAG: ribose 5-phosphate isomerase B [Hyphomonas sp.]|uniref:ribose 5-phosphate isomerase B n=1 Tax=Hyphomonas sp. TaxID=87 RepID=UPI0017C297C0|nr:ribose 5-phosphate isomerase B [Hyphomonas sp.]MBA3067379.1 ribose 5-phosphate isomerase B [Hyphomonas sp.]MBU3922051.1 ribose 5-phosphate isomerase B [Alphaproteobacteria bacterium]MBU4061070.1 ribose 5-phosphate isomerase B [Alphaproteobacteria bacterium]MBU4165926.1 ribose 5-phosphate isomerase B [Alphaproteobacteria bacterium]